jgi:RNA polymerase sigma-70 factor (ECF subfamily)
MTRHRTQGRAAIPDRTDIDLELLQDTQAYLLCRSQRRTPDRQRAQAWGRFYRTYGPLIRHYAVACRVPATDCDDCIQQVWAELVQKLPGFCYDPFRGRFRSWLYTLVRSKATDLLRRRRRRARRLAGGSEKTLCGRDGDPATEYERQCQKAAVQGVLKQLQQRVSTCSYRVLYLRWIEERTVREVAAVLGLTPERVRARTYRMKQQFRRLLEQYTTDRSSTSA